jgi:hypothetical protein
VNSLEIPPAGKSRRRAGRVFFGSAKRYLALLSGIPPIAWWVADTTLARWKPPETAQSALGLARIWRETAGFG